LRCQFTETPPRGCTCETRNHEREGVVFVKHPQCDVIDRADQRAEDSTSRASTEKLVYHSGLRYRASWVGEVV
jgi:hypothetical protein